MLGGEPANHVGKPQPGRQSNSGNLCCGSQRTREKHVSEGREASFELLFKKYILLVMLLQLSHFFSPLFPSALHSPHTSIPPHLSSCPWVVHISSLASSFPILFLTSSCLFCTCYLCFLFPVPDASDISKYNMD